MKLKFSLIVMDLGFLQVSSLIFVVESQFMISYHKSSVVLFFF
jgi:hypothetical protein